MKQIILLIAISTFILSCSKVDNYSAPDSSIYGTIIDKTTNEGIQTEQPDGIKISMVETEFSSPVSINFWTKNDGTYENADLFSNTYKVIPVEGAFVSTDTIVTKIDGRTQVDFTVTPFLSINASVATASNSVIATYTISQPVVTTSIITCKTLCSKVPNVSNTINEYSVSHDLSSMSTKDILATQFSDKITGLTSGNTYYIRVAARTDNANNKYNYSKVFKVTVP